MLFRSQASTLLMAIGILLLLLSGRSRSKSELLIENLFLIYALHGKILSAFRIFIVKMIPQTIGIVIIEYFLIPVIVITICLCISIAFRKITPKIHAVCTGER